MSSGSDTELRARIKKRRSTDQLGAGGDGDGSGGSGYRGNDQGGDAESSSRLDRSGRSSGSRGRPGMPAGFVLPAGSGVARARPRLAAGWAEPVPQLPLDKAEWVSYLAPELRLLTERFTPESPLRIHTGCSGLGACTAALEATDN